jgi:hypothetical protein
MAKRKLVGADDLGWRFHLYHASWVVGITALFVIFDFWIALLIIGVLGAYFVRNY